MTSICIKVIYAKFKRDQRGAKNGTIYIIIVPISASSDRGQTQDIELCKMDV